MSTSKQNTDEITMNMNQLFIEALESKSDSNFKSAIIEMLKHTNDNTIIHVKDDIFDVAVPVSDVHLEGREYITSRVQDINGKPHFVYPVSFELELGSELEDVFLYTLSDEKLCDFEIDIPSIVPYVEDQEENRYSWKSYIQHNCSEFSIKLLDKIEYIIR